MDFLGGYLTILLLQASSLTRKARTDAFWAGVWAWKDLVLRLRLRSARSVWAQWASINCWRTSDTLSRFKPTLVKWSPKIDFAWRKERIYFLIYLQNKVGLKMIAKAGSCHVVCVLPCVLEVTLDQTQQTRAVEPAGPALDPCCYPDWAAPPAGPPEWALQTPPSPKPSQNSSGTAPPSDSLQTQCRAEPDPEDEESQEEPVTNTHTNH